MRTVIASIEGEYRRYKKLGEDAIQQLSDADLGASREGCNSIAVIVWHIAGNLESRFTDFLTTDGEKPWRDRDSEFVSRSVTQQELLSRWEKAWSVLLDTLALLTDGDLGRDVTIRQVPLNVLEALHRSLAHTSYHVGQIVFLAKMFRGDAWRSLSIPRGQSAAYNQNPAMEKPPKG